MRRVLICLLGWSCLATSPQVFAGEGSPDGQLWTEVDVSGLLGENYIVTGVGQLRLSESLSNPVYTALGADLDRKFGDWKLGIGYRHQVTGDREGEDINVTQVARLNVSWSHAAPHGALAIRTRVENILTAASNPWRFRVRAEYRWNTPSLGAATYVYANDEVFYQLYNNQFFRNRAQVGTNLSFVGRYSLLVYLQRQDSKEQTPAAINSLGLTLAISLQ